MPDGHQRISVEQLDDACSVLRGLDAIDPNSMTDGTMLAHRLRGISTAISHVVLAKDDGEEHASRTRTLIRRPISLDPPEQLEATAEGWGLGASIEVCDTNRTDFWKAHRHVDLPTDSHIDTLLATPPIKRSEHGVYASIGRPPALELAYPFNGQFAQEGDPARYFRTLQSLVSQLLVRTNLDNRYFFIDIR